MLNVEHSASDGENNLNESSAKTPPAQDLRYSTLKDEPVSIQEKPNYNPTPSHPKPKFLSKGIAISALILIAIIFISSAIFAAYDLGKNQSNKQASQAPTVTQTPSPTPTIDPTADWKTYTNTQEGWQLKYPSNSKITNEKAYSFMTTQNPMITKITGQLSDDAYSVEIYAENYQNNLSTKGFIDEYLKNLNQPSGNTSNEIAGNKTMSDGATKKITDSLNEYKNGEINGLHALFGSDYDYDVIVMTKNDKVFTFLYNGDQGTKISKEAEKIVQQILSTFKFTNSISPTPSSQSFLKIPEYGVKIPLTENNKDAYVVMKTDNSATYAQLKVHSLDSEPYCNDNSTLGLASITKVSKNNFNERQKAIVDSGNASLIGNYYYFLEGSQAVCSQIKSNQTIETNARKAFNEASKNITAL